MRTLCSVGTTHPWNIAGIGLDARVCGRLGARNLAVIAGVSAQEQGTAAHGPVDAALIAAQLQSVHHAGVDAYRIGALLAPHSVIAIAGALRAVRVPIVCDPVIASSRGFVLADDATVAALRGEIFRYCTLVTPNLNEASRLCGFPVNDRATMAGAAHTLVERDGAAAALVTGGDADGERAVDVLYARGKTTTFEAQRLAGGMRGTGDVLAAAIAIRLGDGAGLIEAIEAARELVREAIAYAVEWNGERVWPWP